MKELIDVFYIVGILKISDDYLKMICLVFFNVCSKEIFFFNKGSMIALCGYFAKVPSYPACGLACHMQPAWLAL